MTVEDAAAVVPSEGLIVVGCSRRKATGPNALPAIEMYEGWCVPRLRRRIDLLPGARGRILVLSARYGLIGADEPIVTYDQQMTPERAEQLRGACTARLAAQLATAASTQILLLLESAYLSALGQLPDELDVHIVSDPHGEWDRVETVLETWGWR